MEEIHHKHTMRRALLVVIAGAGLAAAVLALWQFSALIMPVRKSADAYSPPVVVAPTTKSVESNMLVMGDIYWGRYIDDWSQSSSLKYAYPFQRLSEFERDKYDAWIANMECPITNNPKVSSAVENTTLKFDCSPDYLTEAKRWFTAVSLGNNHTGNQGATGFAETKQHLDDNGIQYFGSYDANDYGNVCDVISMPAHVTLSDTTVKEGRLPLVWCGYDGVFQAPNAQAVAVITKYSLLFGVIVMPHSGGEYKPSPDAIKTTLYRSFIDAGADVVLGGHPHWVQSTEAYKGRLIVYSMGNFIFDQLGSNELTRGAVMKMDVTVDASEVPDIDTWLALGETCGAYADDCLAKVTDEGLTKLPLQYHFSVLGSRDEAKVTHLANETELAGILQRMNWQETIEGLSGNTSGE